MRDLIGMVMCMTLALSACAGDRAPPGSGLVGAASISEADISRHIEVLASDAFGGRAPSSPGEELTTQYIEREFVRMGLTPGNGDSFFQEVPLVDITASPDARLVISGSGEDLSFSYADEMVTWTTRVVDRAGMQDSDMIFVGYGIVAPEYDWNDYEGIDVVGKTVVILVNDPGYATQSPDLFTGNAMTYYGRWTYKFEEAARQGAGQPSMVRVGSVGSSALANDSNGIHLVVLCSSVVV